MYKPSQVWLCLYQQCVTRDVKGKSGITQCNAVKLTIQQLDSLFICELCSFLWK